MRRQDQYADPNIDPMMAAQMQHMSAQRYNNSGMGHFSGGTDSFHPSEEHQYGSSKVEGQWQQQWHKDGPKGSNQMPSHLYKEGQGNDASHYEGQRSDSKSSAEKQGFIDPRVHARQDEVEAAYEDKNLPQTYEGLEQKFLHEIMHLSKELQDAEDRETARHRERLNEINKQYDEKIQTLRAHQASRREEFLRKESQLRHQQYQQANMTSYQNNPVPVEAHGYGAAAASTNTYGDPKRAYGAGHYDPYSERSDYGANSRSGGNGRGRGVDSRGPYPGGRAYNSGGRQF